jgi:hypothetical protein
MTKQWDYEEKKVSITLPSLSLSLETMPLTKALLGVDEEQRRTARVACKMAWPGKVRLTSKFIKFMRRRHWLPRKDDPRGVPYKVMKQLASERLPAEMVNKRLQELMQQHMKGN